MATNGNVTGVASAVLSETIAKPADGLVVDASDQINAYQKLLDNSLRASVYLLADIAALRALSVTGLVNGERVYVQGKGLFEWRASDTTADDSRLVIDPAAAGNGRWWSVEYDWRKWYTDTVTTDSDTTTVASFSTWEDVKDGGVQKMAVTIPNCIAGDLIEVECAARVSTNANGTAFCIMSEGALVTGTTTIVVSGAPILYMRHMVGVTGSGSVLVKLRHTKLVDSTSYLLGGTDGIGGGGTFQCYLRARKV